MDWLRELRQALQEDEEPRPDAEVGLSDDLLEDGAEAYTAPPQWERRPPNPTPPTIRN